MSHIRLLSRTFLFAAFFASAFARDAPPAVQRELIAADRSIWQAVAGSRPNTTQVSQALAPDYIDMELGVSHPREQVLKDLESLTDFSFHYENPRAFSLSPTSGYVIAELTYSSVVDGHSLRGRILTTTVFSKDHGRWLAHLHTEMDMPPAKDLSR
jgi:hypothetical protein